MRTLTEFSEFVPPVWRIANGIGNLDQRFKLIGKNVLNWIIGFEDGFAFAQDSLFTSPFEVNFSHNMTSNINFGFPENQSKFGEIPKNTFKFGEILKSTKWTKGKSF